jgi:hypothetical protein
VRVLRLGTRRGMTYQARWVFRSTTEGRTQLSDGERRGENAHDARELKWGTVWARKSKSEFRERISLEQNAANADALAPSWWPSSSPRCCPAARDLRSTPTICINRAGRSFVQAQSPSTSCIRLVHGCFWPVPDHCVLGLSRPSTVT